MLATKTPPASYQNSCGQNKYLTPLHRIQRQQCNETCRYGTVRHRTRNPYTQRLTQCWYLDGQVETRQTNTVRTRHRQSNGHFVAWHTGRQKVGCQMDERASLRRNRTWYRTHHRLRSQTVGQILEVRHNEMAQISETDSRIWWQRRLVPPRTRRIHRTKPWTNPRHVHTPTR